MTSKTSTVTLVAATTALALTAMAAHPYAANAQGETITVRYGAIPEPQLVAKEKGWFEEALGVPVNWVTISGGANAIAAMQSGSMQIGCGVGTPPIAAALAQGVPLKIFWIQDNAPESLAVNPEAATSVAELEGKRVAALVGSTMYFALVVALGKEGLSARDVDIIDLPVGETLAAYQRGDIDGAILPHPAVDRVMDEGAKIIMSPVDRAETYGYPLFDACVVLDEWAAENPEILKTWVEVEERANKFVRDNPDEAVAIIAEALNIDADAAAFGLNVAVRPSAEEQISSQWIGQPGEGGTGVADAIEITAKFQMDAGRLPAMPKDIDGSIDSSFVKSAVDSQ